MRHCFAVLAFGAFLSSCSQPAAEVSKDASKEPPRQYHLHGEIVRVNAQARTATINAQKIDGWMEAMSMEYPVKDPQGVSDLHPQDCVDATVLVQGNDFWVSDVKHSEAAPGACIPPKPSPPEDKK